MVTTTMAIRTKCYSVRNLIRTLICKWFDMVDFKKRQIMHLKRSRVATAFAMPLGFISNPSSNLGIANVNRAST